MYTWIAEKALPANKVGRLWRFQANEVDDWVRSGAAAEEHRPSEHQSDISCRTYADNSKDQEE